jgi:hypothetical protein
MKIRLGFVSNSSSSSFVVALDHYPSDEQDLMEMMFPGKPSDDVIMPFDMAFKLKDVCQRVYQDITREQYCETTLGNVIDEFMYDEDQVLDYYEPSGGGGCKVNKEKKVENTLQMNKNAVQKGLDWYNEQTVKNDRYLVLLNYSDNDGEFDTALEHGDIFENVPHVRISKH